MQKLKVDLGENSYDILIGADLLADTGYLLKNTLKNKKVLIVSNPTIFPLYGDIVVKSLNNAGFIVITHLIPDGEIYKNLDEANKIIDTCVNHRLERTSSIIALGGGVVGDIAGFVAAIYQRGINYIQIPTTLLAQVDSSVGGKVAVNHPLSKNMIGAFHQPKLVIADTNTLTTIEKRDYISGLGEICKYGIIYDLDFFNLLTDNIQAIREKSPQILGQIIYHSCRIKSTIVADDEKETGIRAILNLGHTFGHAIESLTNYVTYRHGEAVIMGTVAACYLALELDLINEQDFNKIIKLYGDLGILLPFPTLSLAAVYDAMLTDKKIANDQMTFILPHHIGNYAIRNDIEKELVLKAIHKAQQI
ncbi:MAG: 3-dehydroquinate synthase [Syntrophomonadaceae bacterium]|nr:3-dehydroquinate synthase [Syntrophomonadaceae bacterium]